MPGGTMKILDAAGREVIAGIDDQPLRVRMELDVDPEAAPSSIRVEVVAQDGTRRSIDAERIDWGASRPLYESDLTTVDDIFDASLEILDPILGHVPEVTNGSSVSFEYEDLSSDVQVFDSGIDARWWFTQAEVADRIGEATNRGIHLTGVLRQLREFPESEERTALEAEINQRLAQTRQDLQILEYAKAALANPKYWMEQQIRAAQFYMGLDDIRDIGGVHGVLERGKEIAHGHIVSGVKDITIGGYQMLVQATGVAQARTVLTGENELGQAVGWDGRATAFLDLVADGMLQGASLKFELDNIFAPTRVNAPTVEPPVRYDGPSPEKLAPERSIVDPTSMGMTPGAIRAAFRASRMHNKYTLVRPTNPDSLAHLESGAIPKPESLKSKTVGEIDTLLGVAPEARGTVGFFEPTTDFFEGAMRTSGMTDGEVAAQLDALRSGTSIDAPPGYAGSEVWSAAVKRYHQRSAEFDGPTGKATTKLAETGEIEFRDGVIYDTATGKPFAGDHDLFDFIDSMGMPVTPDVYKNMVRYLENSAFRAQHGAHKWWDPQRSDFPPGAYGDAKYETNRGIYEKIIADHKSGEILIVFPPVGPPIALFSGTAPGGYLGHMPGPLTAAGPASSLRLPAEVKFLHVTGTTRATLSSDESIEQWLEAETEFQQGSGASGTEPASDAEIDAFEALAAASAAQAARLNASLESDGGYDLDEFDTESDHEAGEGSGETASDSEAFDALAAASAAQAAELDASLDSDTGYDLDEFDSDVSSDGSSDASGLTAGANRALMIGGAAAAAVVMIVSIFLFGGSGDTSGTPEAAPSSSSSLPASDVTDAPEDTVGQTDGCEEYGCMDMGVMPGAMTATVTWSATSCEETPSSTTGDVEIVAGGTGASFVIPGDGVPGNRVQVGAGEVTGRGFGGGTITSNGVTTGTNTNLEITNVSDTGISGTLETIEGPADDEGRVDPNDAECSRGGAFDLSMDAADWGTLLGLPRSEEPPIVPTAFACSATWQDGFPVIAWAVNVDAPLADPPSPFAATMSVRLDSWVDVPAPAAATTMFMNTTRTPEQLWSLDHANAGTEPPQELLDAYANGGTWGSLDFGTAQTDAQAEGGQRASDMESALDGFSEGDFIDAQIRVTNGVFGAFTISQECPWQ